MITKKSHSLPIGLKIAIKIVAILLLGFFLFGMLQVTVESIVEKNDESNMADYINRCNDYYYTKEYGDLREILVLYDLYAEEFDIYWDAVHTYEQELEEQDIENMKKIN